MSEWSDGFSAGWREAIAESHRGGFVEGEMSRNPKRRAMKKTAPRKSPKRKASAYSKRYGKAFKRLAPRYKKKSGGWKKNGFRLCAAAARKAARK